MVTECELPPAQFLTEKPDKALARPGVYAILCDVSGKYYVGMSKDINRRLREHAKSLRTGTHINRKLSGTYKKYGKGSMLTKVLEFCEPGYRNLYEKENEWIQRLDSVRCGLNLIDAEEFLPGFSISKEARKRNSERMAQKMAPSQVPYDLISPDGVRHTGIGISGFCKKMNLTRWDENGFSSMMRGRSLSRKGWTLANPPQKRIKSYSNISVMSPSGEIHRVRNQANFCKEHNISKAAFGSMCRGDSNECGGWKLVSPDRATPRTYRSNLGIPIMSPSGEVIIIEKMKDFCRQNGLHSSAINHVLRGSRPHHKQWRKPQ